MDQLVPLAPLGPGPAESYLDFPLAPLASFAPMLVALQVALQVAPPCGTPSDTLTGTFLMQLVPDSAPSDTAKGNPRDAPCGAPSATLASANAQHRTTHKVPKSYYLCVWVVVHFLLNNTFGQCEHTA
jgi:hypothetical protein